MLISIKYLIWKHKPFECGVYDNGRIFENLQIDTCYVYLCLDSMLEMFENNLSSTIKLKLEIKIYFRNLIPYTDAYVDTVKFTKVQPGERE